MGKITCSWNKMPKTVLKCSHSVFGTRNDCWTKNITYRHIAFWGSSYLSCKLCLWVTKWFTMQPLFKVCTTLSLNKTTPNCLSSKTIAVNTFKLSTQETVATLNSKITRRNFTSVYHLLRTQKALQTYICVCICVYTCIHTCIYM